MIEWINAGLGVVALLFSVVALWMTNRHSKAAQETQARLLAVEEGRDRDIRRAEQRASLHARIAADRQPGVHRLLLCNSGHAVARDIQITFDGVPFLSHQVVVKGQEPVTVLGPGAEVGYLLVRTMSGPAVVSAAVSWTDNSGEPGGWSSQLSL